MYAGNTALRMEPVTTAISRRGVGKAAWKRVIEELIASEQEDMKDLRTLRRKVMDVESLRLISDLMERKAERVIQLNELLRYSDPDSKLKAKQ